MEVQQSAVSQEEAASQKESEVSFYKDRTNESALRLVRSIIGNPRLTGEEQLNLLLDIADTHRVISTFLFLRAGIDPRKLPIE